MKFCPTENTFGGGPKTRKAPADGQERTISYVTVQPAGA